LSKDVICSTRCIADFSVAEFIKLEYVVGNSFEMKKYVPPQAAPSRRNVIIKILTDNRCLMYFVNSVSHPSDCFDIVSIQLFANVLYVTVNDPIFDLQIVRPQSVK